MELTTLKVRLEIKDDFGSAGIHRDYIINRRLRDLWTGGLGNGRSADSSSSCGRTTVNRHGAAPRVSRTYGKSGDGERGFNLIEKVFGAETTRLQAFVFSKSPGHTGGIGHTRVHGRGPDAPLPLHQGGILPAGVEQVHQSALCEIKIQNHIHYYQQKTTE